jgi:hypothetical protein
VSRAVAPTDLNGNLIAPLESESFRMENDRLKGDVEQAKGYAKGKVRDAADERADEADERA